MLKAYIPLRRKIPGVRGWRWAMPPTPEFCVGDTNMWYILALSNAKICVTPDAEPKICIIPDASQWNIGCVGSQRKMLALAMYISCLFVDFICIWYPTRTPFPVEYGLKCAVRTFKCYYVYLHTYKSYKVLVRVTFQGYLIALLVPFIKSMILT